MIKAVFFDIDNTLYSYDRGNEAGMKALTVYGNGASDGSGDICEGVSPGTAAGKGTDRRRLCSSA